MRYSESDYIDVVATRMDGAATSWLNHEQLAIEAGRRQPWRTWDAFCRELVKAFEPLTDEAVARQQLAVLKQTRKIAGYIQKFREIRGRILDMSVQDEFAAFIRGLQPRIKNQVGPLVEDDCCGLGPRRFRFALSGSRHPAAPGARGWCALG